MIEELRNPYSEEDFRQFVSERAGQSFWFEYFSGGLIFVSNFPGQEELVGVVEKDVVADVLGRERYLLIKRGVGDVQITL
jgi:hypothetical protein